MNQLQQKTRHCGNNYFKTTCCSILVTNCSSYLLNNGTFIGHNNTIRINNVFALINLNILIDCFEQIFWFYFSNLYQQQEYFALWTRKLTAKCFKWNSLTIWLTTAFMHILYRKRLFSLIFPLKIKEKRNISCTIYSVKKDQLLKQSVLATKTLKQTEIIFLFGKSVILHFSFIYVNFQI